MPTDKNRSNKGAQPHSPIHAPVRKNGHTNKSHGGEVSSSSFSISGEPEQRSINRSKHDKTGLGSSPNRDGAIEQVSEGANLNIENEMSFDSSASRRTSIEDSEAGTEGNNR